MIMSRPILKALSVITLCCFLPANVATGGVSVGIEVMPNTETPAFLQIEIPDELARIEEMYEAPPQVDPKLILHVQNAHGNYEAQVKIRKLLRYLYETYGFSLFFVEGAVEKLKPEYLRFFPESERNVELADMMAREGILTGAEFFMVDAPAEVQAVGIENPRLYRENYETFQQVFQGQAEADYFLEQLDQRLSSLAAREFSSDLKRLLSEWKKFETGRRDFLPYVKRLVEDAAKILDYDFDSLFAQVEWPQITRLLVLQSMESDLDIAAGRKERDDVARFLKAKNLSRELIQAVESLEEKRIRMSRLEPEDKRLENLPRFLIERLMDEAGPHGFRFQRYPAFSLYAGYLILRSEVDSKLLFDEIEKMFAMILDELAVNDGQKSLLGIFRDADKLCKLFHLELTRENWKGILDRGHLVRPEKIIKRVNELNTDWGPLTTSVELSKTFDAAIRFYELASQRETVFYYTMKQEMHKRKFAKSTLLTGGFHTQGLLDMLRADKTNYGVLMPQIKGELSNSQYISTMLQEKPTVFDLATLEQPNFTVQRSLLEAMFGREGARYLFELAQGIYLSYMYGQATRPTVPGRRSDAGYTIERFNQSALTGPKDYNARLAPVGDWAYYYYDGELQTTADQKQFYAYRIKKVSTPEGVLRVVMPSLELTTVNPQLPPVLKRDETYAVPPMDTPAAVPAAMPPGLAWPPIPPVTLPGTIYQPGLWTPAMNSELRRILERLEGVRLGDDLLAGLNPQNYSRPMIPSLSTLVSRGVVSPDLTPEEVLEVFDTIGELAEAARPREVKFLRSLEGETAFASDLSGSVVVVRNKPLSDREIKGISTQLVLNSQVRTFYVYTPPPEEPEEEVALFRLAMEATRVEDLVRQQLEEWGISMEGRFGIEVAKAEKAAVTRSVNTLYEKHIRPFQPEIVVEAADERIGYSAFTVFAENGTTGLVDLDLLPQVLMVESDILENVDDEVVQKFVVTWFTQHRYDTKTQKDDAMQALEPTRLREGVYTALDELSWRVVHKSLGALHAQINHILESFEEMAAILRAA